MSLVTISLTLMMAILCNILISEAGNTKIDCRRFALHPYCRGISAKRAQMSEWTDKGRLPPEEDLDNDEFVEKLLNDYQVIYFNDNNNNNKKSMNNNNYHNTNNYNIPLNFSPHARSTPMSSSDVNLNHFSTTKLKETVKIPMRNNPFVEIFIRPFEMIKRDKNREVQRNNYKMTQMSRFHLLS